MGTRSIAFVLRNRIIGLEAIAAVSLTSCAGRQPDDDPHRIVLSVLEQVTAGRQSICVDSRSRGEPLAIFRTMIVAPEPARRPLAWRAPGPLLPERDSVQSTLAANEVIDSRTHRSLANSTAAPLPMVDQVHLNGLAREAMVSAEVPQLQLANSPMVPLAHVRWWPLNRIGSSCGDVYSVSKPVIIRGTAFISVTASHQGTTYALEHRISRWVPVAQWTNWLF